VWLPANAIRQVACSELDVGFETDLTYRLQLSPDLVSVQTIKFFFEFSKPQTGVPGPLSGNLQKAWLQGRHCVLAMCTGSLADSH